MEDEQMTDKIAKKDLVLNDVPNYEEGEADDKEILLKDMLQSMRSEFRKVGRQVAQFEEKLSSTQKKVETLSKKMVTTKKEQEKFRDQARAAASKTDTALTEVKVAQKNIEAKQAEALQKLQQKVLQEVDAKLQGT